MGLIDYTLPLEQLPDPLPIEPLTKPFDVTITPPGSKSITCRAYVLAALAHGESRLIRPLRADDTDHLLNALCTLGAEARWVPGDGHDGEDVLIKGVGGRFPRGGNLYMGDGGAPTRFMIACACLAAEPVTIDASPRMRERPIAGGVDMLRQLGAKIEYVEEEGRLPVRVVPSEGFSGGTLKVAKIASSQFISGVCLVAPWLPLGVRFEYGGEVTSWSYIILTHYVMREWGAAIDTRTNAIHMLDLEVTTICESRISSRVYQIEVDATAATYWFTAASICDQSAMTVTGLPARSPQDDLIYPTILERNGAWIRSSHDARNVKLTFRQPLKGFECEMESMPDAAVSLATASAKASSPSRLTGLGTLRIKESDRLTALATELRKVGCTVETGEDWISIDPPHSPPHAAGSSPTAEHRRDACATEPIIIETYNDHRMAMAFAVLGLNPPNGKRLAIRNPVCVKKSYPGFWRDFAKLYQ